METPAVIKPLFFQLTWSVLLLVVSLVLSGCSLFGDDDELQVDANSGEQKCIARRNVTSIAQTSILRSGLAELESRYPFGKYAEQAQLELIYAHHSALENEAAIEAADRFIRRIRRPQCRLCVLHEGRCRLRYQQKFLLIANTNR